MMELILKDICKAYGEHTVLKHFSCTIPQGCRCAVSAPSGAGKTTLLRLILRLEQPDSGELTGLPKAYTALFQENRLCPGLSPAGNIRAALGRRADAASINAILKKLGLEDCAEQPVSELSGGMARRAALARALLCPGDLLILDEPFNGLDDRNRRIAAETILEYQQGRTILFVTHREDELELLQAQKIIRLTPMK